MTANYSHGGRDWDRKLRAAVTVLEKSLLTEKTAYEKPTEEVGLRKYLISGEPRATRTLGPRLKRAMLYQLS